jgi:general secretion pathway protein D
MAFLIARARKQGREPRRLVALAFAALALAGAYAPCEAEIQTPPPAAVLTDIAVSDTGQGESQISLTFSPLAPKFSIIADGTDKPSIAFALSSRGLGAKFPSVLHGLLRSMAIEQNDTILILHFVAASAVHLVAAPVGDRLISLKFTKASLFPATTASASSGPLPVQLDRDPGQDGFELVPLKYADISEVVGLLTDGQTVKSNDSFTPHEPAFGSAGMGGQATFAPAIPPG